MSIPFLQSHLSRFIMAVCLWRNCKVLMPIHDWSRVPAGIFHSFHVTWLTQLNIVLNERLLPSEYYALAEQIAGDFGPDVLTLHAPGASSRGSEDDSTGGGLAVETAPPRTRYRVTLDDSTHYAAKANRLAVHHVSDDRIVAVIELLSPGNKSSTRAMDAFVDKAVSMVGSGIHLVLVDLFPPTSRDPEGVHERIWGSGNVPVRREAAQRLTCVSYRADNLPEAFIEPLAVGDLLPEMPLFLTRSRYVPLPLEQTYQTAFAALPARYRSVLS